MKSFVVLSALAWIAIAAPITEPDLEDGKSERSFKHHHHQPILTPVVYSPYGHSKLGLHHGHHVGLGHQLHGIYRDGEEGTLMKAASDIDATEMKEATPTEKDLHSLITSTVNLIKSRKAQLSRADVERDDEDNLIPLLIKLAGFLARDAGLHGSETPINTNMDKAIHENIDIARRTLEDIENTFENSRSSNNQQGIVKNAPDKKFEDMSSDELMARLSSVVEKLQTEVDISASAAKQPQSRKPQESLSAEAMEREEEEALLPALLKLVRLLASDARMHGAERPTNEKMDLALHENIDIARKNLEDVENSFENARATKNHMIVKDAGASFEVKSRDKLMSHLTSVLGTKAAEQQTGVQKKSDQSEMEASASTPHKAMVKVDSNDEDIKHNKNEEFVAESNGFGNNMKSAEIHEVHGDLSHTTMDHEKVVSEKKSISVKSVVNTKVEDSQKNTDHAIMSAESMMAASHHKSTAARENIERETIMPEMSKQMHKKTKQESEDHLSHEQMRESDQMKNNEMKKAMEVHHTMDEADGTQISRMKNSEVLEKHSSALKNSVTESAGHLNKQQLKNTMVKAERFAEPESTHASMRETAKERSIWNPTHGGSQIAYGPSVAVSAGGYGGGAVAAGGYGSAAASVSSYGGAVPSAGSYGGAAPSTGSYGGAASNAGSYGGAASSAGIYGGLATSISSYGGPVPSAGSYGGAASNAGTYGGAASSTGSHSGAASNAGSYSGAASSASSYGGAASNAGGYGGAASSVSGYGDAASSYGGVASSPGGYSGAAPSAISYVGAASSAGGYGGAVSSAHSLGGAAGGGGGAGAVGVFPNARVGNCAVPLLLSCSPSVVSGSLAHAPSSGAAAGYGAPAHAYRTHEAISGASTTEAKKIDAKAAS